MGAARVSLHCQLRARFSSFQGPAVKSTCWAVGKAVTKSETNGLDGVQGHQSEQTWCREALWAETCVQGSVRAVPTWLFL